MSDARTLAIGAAAPVAPAPSRLAGIRSRPWAIVAALSVTETSWVRSRRALALTLAYLRGFRDGGRPGFCPAFPPVSAYFG